ncbi:hypothetical protein D3C79_1032320 [compost metagenome]
MLIGQNVACFIKEEACSDSRLLHIILVLLLLARLRVRIIVAKKLAEKWIIQQAASAAAS